MAVWSRSCKCKHPGVFPGGPAHAAPPWAEQGEEAERHVLGRHLEGVVIYTSARQGLLFPFYGYLPE